MATKLGAAANGQTRVTADFATTDKGTILPFLDVRPEFVLVYNQRRWMVMHGRLVPSLHVMPLEAGVNGVLRDRKGRIRFARARARLEETGRILIPYEWGPGGESYMQVIDTRPSGGAHVAQTFISIWETGAPGDNEVYTDDQEYAKWAASLVSTGKVPACPPQLARRMREQTQQKLAREEAIAEKGGAGSGAAKLRAAVYRDNDKILAKAASTPKRAKGRPASPALEGS
ncbi:MAG TPA: hypothetical protein QGF58_21520 [Myxococcota bacterium]|nr:hypothetical protein [Myxococcota bacterium]